VQVFFTIHSLNIAVSKDASIPTLLHSMQSQQSGRLQSARQTDELVVRGRIDVGGLYMSKHVLRVAAAAKRTGPASWQLARSSSWRVGR